MVTVSLTKLGTPGGDQLVRVDQLPEPATHLKSSALMGEVAARMAQTGSVQAQVDRASVVICLFLGLLLHRFMYLPIVVVAIAS